MRLRILVACGLLVVMMGVAYSILSPETGPPENTDGYFSIQGHRVGVGGQLRLYEDVVTVAFTTTQGSPDEIKFHVEFQDEVIFSRSSPEKNPSWTIFLGDGEHEFKGGFEENNKFYTVMDTRVTGLPSEAQTTSSSLGQTTSELVPFDVLILGVGVAIAGAYFTTKSWRGVHREKKLASIMLVVIGISMIGISLSPIIAAFLFGGRHMPTDDSYARNSLGDFVSETYGSSSYMLIDKNPNDISIGYMKFDLSQIDGSVKWAKLNVCYYSYNPGFSMELWSAGDSWNEATLCWNNKPQELQKLGSTYISKQEQETWVEFDVTSFINSQIAGDKVASFALGAPDYSEDKYTYVRTKEFSDYYAPYLTYETTIPPPTYFTLTTSVQPYGGGSVTPSSGDYLEGTRLTIRASPSTGYGFSHWSGDASGTSSTITITMDSNKSVIANFKIVPPLPPVEKPDIWYVLEALWEFLFGWVPWL